MDPHQRRGRRRKAEVCCSQGKHHINRGVLKGEREREREREGAKAISDAKWDEIFHFCARIENHKDKSLQNFGY